MNFDWQKYNRVFAFGCSFTNYIYPTWADIIAYEMPDVEYYNFGKSGMGNLAIASRIAEANTMFKFNDTDLVLVMYSTMYREDRWLEGTWQSHGNVYNQGYYDKSFVKKYVDPAWCLIRDLSLIELSSKYLKSLPCDSLILKSSTLDSECIYVEDTVMIDNIKERYSELWDGFPPSLYETIRNNNGWDISIKRILDGRDFEDSHPSPIEYYRYLTTIGVNLSEATKERVLEDDRICHSFIEFSDWNKYYPELYKNYLHSIKFLF